MSIETGGPAFPMQEPQAIHAFALAAVDGITDPDERDFAKTEIARLHDDIRELTGVLVLDEEDSAHHKALAESALRVAKGWEGKCRELRTKIEAAEKERDALRAKIEAMEQQEPVGWLLDGDFYEVRQMSLYKDNEPLPGQTALYALPGAQTQGEEK